MKTHFSPFKKYFGTGYGLKLQKLDSDIAEAVMMEFARRGIPILPLHDSFIVHYGYESMLQEVMQKKFEWATHSKITLKTVVMDTSEYARRRSFGDNDEPVTNDIQELLNPTGPFAAYDRRIFEWFRKKDAMDA